MRVTVSTETSVPLAEAWAWWTDFGEPGQEFMMDHGIGPSRRRIVERDAARVVMEDALPLPGGKGVRMYRREVRMEDGHRMHERGDGMPPYESEWRFESTPAGGTRIVRDLEVKSGVMDFTGRLGERVTRQMLEKDLRHHVKDLEASRRAGGASAGATTSAASPTRDAQAKGAR